MKKLFLTIGLAVMASVGWGQTIDTLYAQPNISHTVTIWDTPNISISKSIGYIKHVDGVVVFTDKVYGNYPKYYMLSDSSGYVTLNNQFTKEKIEYNYPQNTKESLGWVSEPIEPCSRAEYYRRKYLSTGSMIDLDNYRKWTSECLNKEY